MAIEIKIVRPESKRRKPNVFGDHDILYINGHRFDGAIIRVVFEGAENEFSKVTITFPAHTFEMVYE